MFPRNRVIFIAGAIATLLVISIAYGVSLKVGLVLDKGGRDDKSFNASAYRGGTEAKEKLGINLKVLESSDDSSLEANLRALAERGFELVIGIGFVQEAPIQKVAKEFSKVKFLLVDGVVDLPNVRSVVFREHEGAYLVGAAAALTTKTNTIGFVGGMDIPLIRRFAMGYEAGIKAVNPKIKVIINYVGSGSDAWRNPTRAKELALSQYKKSNADIIFTAAGASSMGVFDAAEEMKRFAIGCDSNQNWIKPGRILTSMIKAVDVAVFETIDLASRQQFTPGKISLGVREKGIDFAVDSFNEKILPPPIVAKLNSIKEKIRNNEIKVMDYYEVSKKNGK